MHDGLLAFDLFHYVSKLSVNPSTICNPQYLSAQYEQEVTLPVVAAACMASYQPTKSSSSI